jgi:hypothetical protein
MYRKHAVALPGTTTFAILLRFGAAATALSTYTTAVKISLLGYYRNVIEIG